MSPHLFRRHTQEFKAGLSRLSVSRDSSPHIRPDTIPASKQIEEETLPKYNVKAFYPVRFDEILNERYQVVAKLGFGVTATVWLAKDLKPSHSNTDRKYVTVKINTNTLSENWLNGRRTIAERLLTANPDHIGYKHIRFFIETFKVKGPHGQHLCVVYDVLRDPIDQCMEKWPGRHFTGDQLRLLLPALLQGLDYLHGECHIVHTDIKADNIMMGLGGPDILDNFVQGEATRPSPRKLPDASGRIIYQSCNEFSHASSDAIISSAKLTDIGLAVFGDEPHTHAIQSNAFTAPEVILTAGWSYPADIWNLGVMLWDLLESFGLFDTIDTADRYRRDQHLGLMIALLGPPPPTLLSRGAKTSTYFDEQGNFKKPHLIPRDFTFASSITRLKGKDKELFIDFAKKMVCWLPEERWTARQLLDHPWLKVRTASEVDDDNCEEEGTEVPDLISRSSRPSQVDTSGLGKEADKKKETHEKAEVSSLTASVQAMSPIDGNGNVNANSDTGGGAGLIRARTNTSTNTNSSDLIQMILKR